MTNSLRESFENHQIGTEKCEHSQISQNNLLPIEEELSVKKKSGNFSLSEQYDEQVNQYARTDYYQQYPVEDRTIMWEINRRKKIESIKNRKKNSELSECTFKPLLSSQPNDYMRGSQQIDGKVNIASIDKFLSRMYSARIDKEKLKIEQENCIGSGKNWK
mmetsp:Transcript_3041/g.2521  ORF Transcript_3041/g.2521 Transcript_3041/m.2521 type:complete len:161 (+) Transcript_3041:176-658(+)